VRRISRLSRRRWRSLYVVETYSTNCLLRCVRSRQSNQWRRGNEKEGKKTTKTFSVETFFDRKNIFFFLQFFLLWTLNFSLFSSLSFRSMHFFEKECFCVRFFLCICASEWENFFCE
jgi:hypothetical protein